MTPPASGAAMGVSAPSPDARMRQSTPRWMETTLAQSQIRRGLSPAPRSGLHTFLFFGLIVAAVGAAGTASMVLWGPDKTVTRRMQLATDPPSFTLPSLPVSSPSAPAATPPEPVHVAAESPAPAPRKIDNVKTAPKPVRKKAR